MADRAHPDLEAEPAYYVPLGEGRWRATEHTAGPWDPALQHAGPPSALLARELERCSPRPEMFVGRLTFELLGPVPVGELELDARVGRPGRGVELVQASARANGREVMRAAAWHVARTEAATVADPYQAPPRPGQATPLGPVGPRSGYLSSIEWRYASGTFGEPGPAVAWTRMRVALVAGEAPSALARLLVVADSASGISSVLAWDEWLFINPELTVHLHRLPEGEWVCMDAATMISRGAAGLTISTLADDRGAVARGAQTLLVRPRSDPGAQR